MKMGVDVLPRWERLIYWIGGVGSMLYTLYSFYRQCQDKKYYLHLEPGIKFLGGAKDAPDPEWINLLRQIPAMVPFLVGHILLGYLLHSLHTNVRFQKSARLIYDVLVIMYMFGIRSTLLCIVQASIMYLVTLQGRTVFVWVIALMFTSSLNIEWILLKQLHFVQCKEEHILEFFISISYVHIRLISSCIEIIKHKNALKSHTPDVTATLTCQKKSHYSKRSVYKPDSYSDPPREISIIDFFMYIFYLPIFFNGPIVTFDAYLSQLFIFNPSDNHRYDLKEISKKILKIVLIAAFIEFQFHFLYIVSAQDPSFIESLPTSALIGLGWWQGMYFYLKYVCSFGISQVFYVMDGLSPIPLPACIAWIYSFSEMWKVFDVGLYRFIKNYIYIPWGGSQAGFVQQILATVLAFSFMCYWHGGDAPILVWCCGNLIVILMEIVGSLFEHSARGLKMKAIVGAANVVRLKGLLASPLYLASSLQIMYFFFYYEAGNVMVNNMVWNVTWKTLLLEWAGFYCFVQNAMLIHRWIKDKTVKSKDD